MSINFRLSCLCLSTSKNNRKTLRSNPKVTTGKGTSPAEFHWNRCKADRFKRGENCRPGTRLKRCAIYARASCTNSQCRRNRVWNLPYRNQGLEWHDINKKTNFASGQVQLFPRHKKKETLCSSCKQKNAGSSRHRIRMADSHKTSLWSRWLNIALSLPTR